MRTRARGTALALPLVLLLASCGAGDGDDDTGAVSLSARSPADGEAPPDDGSDGGDTDGGDAEVADAGLDAVLQQSTLFATRRAFRLSVRNEGADDVVVETVQLSSPLFETVAPEDRDAPLDAGGRPTFIPLRFGEARCTGDGATADPGDAEVVAVIDGEERHVPVEQRPADMLADVQATECAAAGVLADVDLRLGDRWTPTGPRTVAGELTVAQRRSGVTAELVALDRNVIFAVDNAEDTGANAPWLAVDDDRPAGSVPITITAARCDPHALVEYKRTFILVALVAMGGAAPVRVDVHAEGGARAALEDLLTTCIG
jgi:hypothetical protein